MATVDQQPAGVEHLFRSTKDINPLQIKWIDDAKVNSSEPPTFSQVTLTYTRANPLPELPPQADLTHYSMNQREFLVVAFTRNSCNSNAALRRLLDFVLTSAFILEQTHEPFLADKPSLHLLERIIHLPQCPPIDFRNSKRSLFTLFVERAPFVEKTLFRCLFCGLCKTSMPRALGCVRSHLGHKPFRCSGCQSCNPVDGSVDGLL